MDIQRNRNSVYKIGYHIVWCTKYRKKVLTDGADVTLKNILIKTAEEQNFSIENMEIMPDHVHLFISATPNHLIADVVKVLKGVSARFVFKDYPKIKDSLYGGHLWNPSYYVGTVGDMSEDVVKKYIESQKEV